MKKRSLSSPQLYNRNTSSPVPPPPSSSTVGSGPPTNIDPKLLHLVRKLTAGSTDSSSSLPSTEYVVNCLRTQHREYQRKDSTWLKRNVERALKEENLIRQQRPSNNNSHNVKSNNGSDKGGNRSNRKRPLPQPASASTTIGDNNKSKTATTSSDLSSKQQKQRKLLGGDNNDGKTEEGVVEPAEERLYEKQAQYHDQLRQDFNQTNGLGGSMLNASLRNRYKEVQEKQQASAIVTVQEDGNDDDNDDVKVNDAEDKALMNAESSKMIIDETGTTPQKAPKTPSSSSGAPPPSPGAGTTSKSSSKRLRRKKSGLNRSSSTASESTTGRGKGGGGLPGMPTTEDSVATPAARPRERYKDLGGMVDILQQIRQLIEYPLVRPEVYRHLGVDPPRGVLLRGPPGCGKTHLANAIAGQLGLPYFRVSAPELVSSMSGESEGRIRDLFKAASDSAPSLIFMDELDAIAPKRGDSSGGGGRGMEKRMVAQLLTSLDSIDPQYNRNDAPVLVLGATNRPDAMDPALRRAGRFDKEIVLGVPDEEAREGIIRAMTKEMRLSGDFNFKILARKTPGYVGADVRSLTKEAAVIAINRIFSNILTDQQLPSTTVSLTSAKQTTEPSTPLNVDDTRPVTKDGPQKKEEEDGSMPKEEESTAPTDIFSVTPLTADQMEPLHITMSDFLSAIPLVQPSSKREGFATVPDVSWDDIGALQSVREELSLSVLEPIQHPEKFQALGLPLPAGVMLYGPPGCGKTLLAKAIANESGANFISVKGPELLDKYVGESERAVRVVFERARSSSPCVVFFDELDSLCPKRGSDGGGGGGVSERVVNQLLTEMDGLDSRRSVFVIAATNRPELIDPAMMRPGRLDKLLYVPLPQPNDRVSILKAISGKIKLGPDVCLETIGRSSRAEGYSGADCAALLREAGLAVLKESQSHPDKTRPSRGDRNGDSEKENPLPIGPLFITARHFQYAFDHVMPSVSKKDQAKYDRMRQRMARARTRGGVADETTSNNGKTDEQQADEKGTTSSHANASAVEPPTSKS